MNTTESLAVGILVALVVWLVTSGGGWIIRRRAISKAILCDVHSRIEIWSSNKPFLDSLIDSDLRAGGTVRYTDRFQPSRAILFNSLLSEIIVYLPDKFVKIYNIYSAFRDAEELLFGLFKDLTVWKQTFHILNEDDITYLKAKKVRIESYISIFNEKKRTIINLDDLPDDYQGIQGADTITRTIRNVP